MAKRKIHTESKVCKQGFTHEAKVYRDPEWNEYVVTFWLNGKKIENESYHTDCKDDAIDTAIDHISNIGSGLPLTLHWQPSPY